ncbi:MAG: hypothetical protein BGO05_00055 [Rhizobiales bacterium 63-7]|nr:COG4223 family protein [Hyphomicrobiales bacterium]OJU68330.1 MAG: hypothetical protein BGO05_00055 [Rhizobiales bacterium 63-7]
MVEDPPRHTRSPDEPITIEGTAERITEPTDTASPAEDNAPPPQETPDAASAGLEADKPQAPPETVAAEPEPEPVKVEPAETPEPEETEPPRAPTWTQAPPAPTAVKQTATSTLVAAGIFGGLVALALAGAMQYAGVLPGAGATKPADTGALSAEIDALRQQVAALPTAPVAPATDPALEQRIAALEAKVAPLADDIDKVSNGLAALGQTAASGTGDVTARLDEIEKKLSEPQNDGAVARTIALTALRSAIDRGGAFSAELDALASVSHDDPAIGELRPLASGDLPSRAELVEQFPDVAFAMIEAVNQPGPDSGIGERLFASALSIVKVRNVGDVEGTGPDAITARIEDKLKKGALKDAVAEWDTLPEAAKTAGAAFKARLDARIRAEDLLSAVAAATNKQS